MRKMRKINKETVLSVLAALVLYDIIKVLILFTIALAKTIF